MIMSLIQLYATSLKIICIHMKTCTNHAKLFKNDLHSTKNYSNACKTILIKQKININTDIYTQN